MLVTNGQLRSNSRPARDVPYPVQAEVEYRLKQGRRVVEVGRSRTVSLSASQVVLDSERRLTPGMEIDLILTWPGPLGTLGRLVLRVHGRTLAGAGKRTKVQIDRYGFKTRPEWTAAAASRKITKSIGTAHLPHATPFAS